MSRGRGKRTEQVVAAAIKILREIQPTSVRSVCYQLFVAGLIPSMEKSPTNSISRLLTLARENDEIPWDWIVDESREAEYVLTWSSADERIAAAVRNYRRDYWQDQHFHVEVWSEKGTVRGTLGPVLDEYGVTFRVMHGYASATVINDIAKLSNTIGKPFVALYVGDWDPSGKHMSDVDLPGRLREYGAELKLKRVALVKVDLAKLPSFNVNTKRADPRYQWFRRSIGGPCYELDALSPPILRTRVEQHIRQYIDWAKWDNAIAVEAVEKSSMQDLHKSWQAIISGRSAP